MKIVWGLSLITIGLVIGYLNLDGSMVPRLSDQWKPAGRMAPVELPAPRAACEAQFANKRAFFGDLHVHTALSWDASRYGTIATPADAYRFASGEEIVVA